jgi:predicted RNA-binding protein with PUA-like domain
MARKYWLFKTEPSEFSIEDLVLSPNHTAVWDGVRNYQARNLLRDEVRPDDLALFYHSSTKNPGIAGVVRVVTAGYPDRSAFDVSHAYYDPKSSPDSPRWFAVDVRLVLSLADVLPLVVLKQTVGLEEMMVVRRGARLSIQPVTVSEWQIILGLMGPVKVRAGVI